MSRVARGSTFSLGSHSALRRRWLISPPCGPRTAWPRCAGDDSYMGRFTEHLVTKRCRYSLASPSLAWVRRLLVAMLVVASTAGCSSASATKISNDTNTSVTVVSCVQDGTMSIQIRAGGRFSFNDSVGTRATADDPGFACVLRTDDGTRLCLTMPTDQSARNTYRVSEAVPTPSESACFSRSYPHL